MDALLDSVLKALYDRRSKVIAETGRDPRPEMERWQWRFGPAARQALLYQVDWVKPDYKVGRRWADGRIDVIRGVVQHDHIMGVRFNVDPLGPPKQWRLLDGEGATLAWGEIE